ncbi:hypothetical protein EDB80DRAFT_711087 [Ilyonectria destructans]|nr:hypothetical protein EDB80DRAFT_711087 [Ilyonectria destructans]
MHRRSKQKSCFNCVGRKRRCDRTLPSCTRCIDQGTDCAYPSPTNRFGWSSLGVLDAEFSGDGNLALFSPPEPHARASVGASALASQSHSTHNGSGTDISISPASVATSTSVASGSMASSVPTLSTASVTVQPQVSGDLRWFTQPSTWKIAYHYQPPEALPPPQDFSNFVRDLRSWLVLFQREGHNPFIHRHLYPARAIPDCIQDAYSAIAVSQGGNADNENMVDIITSSYASKLISFQATLTDQPLHLVTVKDHLARTQSLLIHLLLALSSSSISHQTKAEGFIEILHRWKGEMLASAEQEASLAQLFPCTPSISPEGGGPGNDPVPDLHRAFVICESIRRTWLLSSMAIGVYRSLKGDWTSTCGGDIRFTARAGLWDALSSARWAEIVRKKDPMFDFSLRGEALVKSGVPAVEVDEFAHHLFNLMWGTDKVESWFVRTHKPGSILH